MALILANGSTMEQYMCYPATYRFLCFKRELKNSISIWVINQTKYRKWFKIDKYIWIITIFSWYEKVILET